MVHTTRPKVFNTPGQSSTTEPCSLLTPWNCRCVCVYESTPATIDVWMSDDLGCESLTHVFPVWDRSNRPSSCHRSPSCCRSTWITDTHYCVQLCMNSRALNSGLHTCAVTTYPLSISPASIEYVVWGKCLPMNKQLRCLQRSYFKKKKTTLQSGLNGLHGTIYSGEKCK